MSIEAGDSSVHLKCYDLDKREVVSLKGDSFLTHVEFNSFIKKTGFLPVEKEEIALIALMNIF